jgi:cell division protein FtsB
MREIHSSVQPKKPSFFHSWFFIAILFFLLGIFVRSTYASFVKKKTAEQEAFEFQKHLLDLEQKQQNLEHKIQKLETDRGLEEEFRRRFNVVKEGETMIRIVE